MALDLTRLRVLETLQPRNGIPCHLPIKGRTTHPVSRNQTTLAKALWREKYPFCPVPERFRVLCCSHPEHVIHEPLSYYDWDNIKYPYQLKQFYVRYRNPDTYELSKYQTNQKQIRVLQLKDDLTNIRPYLTLPRPPKPPATIQEAIEILPDDDYVMSRNSKDLVPDRYRDRVEHGIMIHDLRTKLTNWSLT